MFPEKEESIVVWEHQSTPGMATEAESSVQPS